jgi:uncharacterized damage-inducible protein DinB
VTREAWQRGPVAGVAAELQPAAHAVLHAREDLDAAVPGIPPEHVWAAPGGVASIGFHLVHLAGSTHRLLTYARGEALSQEQWEWLELEKAPQPQWTADVLMRHVHGALDAALAQIRTTDPTSLNEARFIGRARIEVTLRGLLFHAGEHAARHAGQVITTARLLQALPRARDVDIRPKSN